jgi:hypothetical protein
VRKRRADGAARAPQAPHAGHAAHETPLLLQAPYDEAAAAAKEPPQQHAAGAADVSFGALLLPPPCPAAAAAAVSGGALRDRTLVLDGALAAYVAAHLAPLCATARHAFEGRAARPLFLAAAACGRLPRICLAAHAARALAWRPLALGFAALVRTQRALVATRLASLDDASAATSSAPPTAPLPCDADGDAPAWRALANTPAPGEEEFRTFYTMHSVGHAAVDDIRCAATSDPDDATEVWAAEGHAGHSASLELAAAAGALLAHAKMGPLKGYLHAAALLLELLSGYCDDVHASLLTREAWLAEADALTLAAAAAAAGAGAGAGAGAAAGAGAGAGADAGAGAGALKRPCTPPWHSADAAAAAPPPQLLPAAVAAAMMPTAPPPTTMPAQAQAPPMLHAAAIAAAIASAHQAAPEAPAGFRQPGRGSPPASQAQALPGTPPQQPLPGSHFLRLWQSLLYHGVRPGLTAL